MNNTKSTSVLTGKVSTASGQKIDAPFKMPKPKPSTVIHGTDLRCKTK